MRAAREPGHTKEHGQVCAPLCDWACARSPPFRLAVLLTSSQLRQVAGTHPSAQAIGGVNCKGDTVIALPPAVPACQKLPEWLITDSPMRCPGRCAHPLAATAVRDVDYWRSRHTP